MIRKVSTRACTEQVKRMEMEARSFSADRSRPLLTKVQPCNMKYLVMKMLFVQIGRDIKAALTAQTTATVYTCRSL